MLHNRVIFLCAEIKIKCSCVQWKLNVLCKSQKAWQIWQKSVFMGVAQNHCFRNFCDFVIFYYFIIIKLLLALCLIEQSANGCIYKCLYARSVILSCFSSSIFGFTISVWILNEIIVIWCQSVYLIAVRCDCNTPLSNN